MRLGVLISLIRCMECSRFSRSNQETKFISWHGRSNTTAPFSFNSPPALFQEENEARQSIPCLPLRVPIFPHHNPCLKLPSLPSCRLPDTRAAAVIGALFGYRKGRVSLSIQENPRTLPTLVLELAMQTQVLQKEISLGMVRIALECEKREEKDKTRLVDELQWTMLCNGKKIGYGVKREATEEDLHAMEVLKAVSWGRGCCRGCWRWKGPTERWRTCGLILTEWWGIRRRYLC